MIVDFHVHLAAREHLRPGPAAFCDRFWEQRGDWDAVLSAEGLDTHLEQEGVDLAVGLPEVSPLVTGVTTNEYVHERFSGCRRVVLFASLNPWATRGLGGEVERLAGLGFRGVKLYPTYQYYYPNDRMLYPLYSACCDVGWPVMVHTGSSVFPGAKLKFGDPLHLDEVAVDFPELVLLLVHGGRGFWYDRAEFLAQLHAHVYLEVSGLPPKKLPEYFPNLERLQRKVVFGSDWPAGPGIAENLRAVRQLPLSAQTIEAILGGNAARILELDAVAEA